MTFPEYTRKKRIEASLTQQQVASILTFPRKELLKRREDGEIPWKVWEAARLAELLGMKFSEFYKEYEEIT